MGIPVYIDGNSTGEVAGKYYNPVQKALRTALLQLLEYSNAGNEALSTPQLRIWKSLTCAVL